MKHLLTEEQQKNYIRRMGVRYKFFKVRKNADEIRAYREGVVDLLDSLQGVASELAYDIHSPRDEIEICFDEIDQNY